MSRFARGYKKRTCLSTSPFYTPKRFRTAVAGMKIPSPGPLDDRGVLCEDKYRILLNNVKGGLIIFFEGAGTGIKKNQLFSWFLYTLDGLKKRAQLALSSFYTALGG